MSDSLPLMTYSVMVVIRHLPMGAEEFMCLCIEYVKCKMVFLVIWAILDLSIC